MLKRDKKMTESIIKLDEKYRPKTFADLVGNQQIVKDIIEMIKDKNMPHLMLNGNAGTGKTSTAHVIIKHLYNGVSKRKFIEINASEENGVDVVRTRIKEFAKMSKGSDGVGFRIIILDEVDELTSKAQAALRRIMEIYYKHCRFILICNYKWKIIDPIQSRCTVFDFSKISCEEMYPRLSYICENEGIDIEEKALQFVAKKSNGDMRTALNSYLERLKTRENKVTLDYVKRFDVDCNSALKIIKDGLNGRFVKGRQTFFGAIKRGLEIRDVLKKIDATAVEQNYPNDMKGDIALACLESEELLLKGCTNDLVIAGFVARLSKIGRKY